MLEQIETVRLTASKELDPKKRSELGQFMTPIKLAEFMASLFRATEKPIELLDAGAGVGSLTGAFIDNQLKRRNLTQSLNVNAYDVDESLLAHFNRNIQNYVEPLKNNDVVLGIKTLNIDFIEDATWRIVTRQPQILTHAILNPPYKKINSQSRHRHLLRDAGIETVNLYSAFVALAILLLKEDGELVAIIPRSFCNGNYYKSFRRLLASKSSIKQIHLFDSRNKAFKDDDVLQENIIIHLVKGEEQGNVIISKSTDAKLDDLTKYEVKADQIIKLNDTEAFIHIPHAEINRLDDSPFVTSSLEDLEITVSTGPVVDFRAREHLSIEASKGFMPLLYPVHFNGKEIDWPKQSKKPNAIAFNEQTRKMLYPSGFYTVVRRFSSKEEKQRIVARVINPNKLESEFIGIENHLNVFHHKKQGIPEDLAYGIAAYLNSSFVDNHFRSFNGHTQVNATDLKQMKYPSRAALIKLGKWAKELNDFAPETLDKQIEKLL